MNDLTEALSNPTWWLTAIFVGFSMNLLANYAMRFLDKRKAERNEARREKLSLQNAKISDAAEQIKNHQHNQIMTQLFIIHEEVRNNRTFLVSVLYAFFSLLALSFTLLNLAYVIYNSVALKVIFGTSIGSFGVLSIVGLRRWRKRGREISEAEDALWLGKKMQDEENDSE